MLKAIRRMINKPVTIDLFDRESNCVENIGGGIKSNNPKMVLILRGLSDLWLAAEWRHSGQIIIVPTKDVICIGSDLV